MLSGMGFLEIKSNSLTKESYFDNDDPTVVRIQNALSQDLSCMRQRLLPGGLETVIYNINRRRPDLRLYEFGYCYFKDPEKKAENPQENYAEELRLGIFLTGVFTGENWTTAAEPVSYYHLKSMVMMVLDKLGIDVGKLEVKEVKNEVYDQALEYHTDKGRMITLGKVSDVQRKSFDIRQEVYAAEFNWDLVLQLHKKSKVTFRPLPRFPEVRRDLSLMLDIAVQFEQLRDLAFRTERKFLKQVDLFDVYEGEKIESGKKSYALSFILRDEEKTLADKQIDKAMGRISKAFEQELGAVVRGG